MRKTNKQFKANALTAAPPARSAARDAVRAIRRTEEPIGKEASLREAANVFF
jgi:hypothetical protein